MVQWEKDTNKALEKDCQTAAAAFGRLEKGSTRIRPRQYADLRSCHIWLEAPPYPMEKKRKERKCLRADAAFRHATKSKPLNKPIVRHRKPARHVDHFPRGTTELSMSFCELTEVAAVPLSCPTHG